MLRLHLGLWRPSRWIVVLIATLSIGVGFPMWLSAARHSYPLQNTQPSLVSVSGRQLLVRRRLPDGSLGNPEAYVMRGVNWSPAGPTTQRGNEARRAEFWNWYATDIPLLKAMNVNTVRLFIHPGIDAMLGPRGLQVLDELYRNGIMVVMTVNEGNSDVAKVSQVVNYYKQHPAVLLWLLGNEWNVTHCVCNTPGCPKLSDLAQYIENTAAEVKKLDASHPVATSYGELGFSGCDATLFEDTRRYVNQVCQSVDVWGLNLYRGNTFGNLFAQWAALSQKPMFLCEFGTDALFTNDANSRRLEGSVQAHWDFSLWQEIAANLSARNPDKVALGGCLFEWNDEWWKVGSPGAQEFGGYTDNPSGHPDGVGNEEFFGLVDIQRQKRPVYDLFKVAFDPAYQPRNDVPLRLVSRGARAQEYAFQNGVIRFFKSGAKLYEKTGSLGGRGFTVVALNAVNGELLREIKTFDTWNSPDGQVPRAFIAYLNSLSNGALILLGVADEAGLTVFDSCTQLNTPWANEMRSALTALGSTKIQDYCYRGSWAMAAIKGEGRALQEFVSPDQEAVVDLLFPVSHFPYEGDLAPASSGNGAVTASDWVRAGRLIAGLESVASLGEFQRLDCAPIGTLGDGRLTVADWIQVGRYAAGLDTTVLAGGPATPVAAADEKVSGRQMVPGVLHAEISRARHGAGKPAEHTVLISLTAQGSEAAVGFSLQFDARHWRLQEVQPGVAANGARVFINDAQAAQGRLGVMLALTAGENFSPDQHQLLGLRFTSLKPKPEPLGLSWGDVPVARTITDQKANSLTAHFQLRSLAR